MRIAMKQSSREATLWSAGAVASGIFCSLVVGVNAVHQPIGPDTEVKACFEQLDGRRTISKLPKGCLEFTDEFAATTNTLIQNQDGTLKKRGATVYSLPKAFVEEHTFTADEINENEKLGYLKGFGFGLLLAGGVALGHKVGSRNS